jgi:hypothetical protein
VAARQAFGAGRDEHTKALMLLASALEKCGKAERGSLPCVGVIVLFRLTRSEPTRTSRRKGSSPVERSRIRGPVCFSVFSTRWAILHDLTSRSTIGGHEAKSQIIYITIAGEGTEDNMIEWVLPDVFRVPSRCESSAQKAFL